MSPSNRKDVPGTSFQSVVPQKTAEGQFPRAVSSGSSKKVDRLVTENRRFREIIRVLRDENSRLTSQALIHHRAVELTHKLSYAFSKASSSHAAYTHSVALPSAIGSTQIVEANCTLWPSHQNPYDYLSKTPLKPFVEGIAQVCKNLETDDETIETLTKKSEETRKKITDLEAEVQHLKKKNDLETEVQHLKKKNDDMEKLMKSKVASLEELIAKTTAISASNDVNLRKHIKDLRDKNAHLASVLKNTTTALEKSIMDFSRLGNIASKATASNTQQTMQMAWEKQKLNKANKEIRDLSRRLEKGQNIKRMLFSRSTYDLGKHAERVFLEHSYCAHPQSLLLTLPETGSDADRHLQASSGKRMVHVNLRRKNDPKQSASLLAEYKAPEVKSNILTASISPESEEGRAPYYTRRSARQWFQRTYGQIEGFHTQQTRKPGKRKKRLESKAKLNL